MTQTNKHHHRKVSRDNKQDNSSEKESGATQAGSGPGDEIQTSPLVSDEQNNSEESDSKLHLANATLQTTEEHEQDKNTDQAQSDKTEATRI